MKVFVFLMSVISFIFWSNQGIAQEVGSLQDSFKISGSAGFQLTSYNSNGIQARRQPFSYLLHGNVNLSKGDLAFHCHLRTLNKIVASVNHLISLVLRLPING
jgi:hypothetical protein